MILECTVLLSCCLRWAQGSVVSSLDNRDDCTLNTEWTNISTELASVPWDGRHALEVNRKVTSAYLRWGRWWAQIIDPATNSSSTGAWPTWFAFAPYASREVGRVLLLLNSLIELKVAAGVVQSAQILNRKLVVDARCGPLRVCWGQVGGMIWRLATLVLPAPKRVVATIYNMLEHGNRLICEHIAGAAEQYAMWRRKQRTVTPDLLLAEFRLQPSRFRAGGVPASTSETNPAATRELFEAVAGRRDPRALLGEHRCVDILVVAFAAWEAAGVEFRKHGASAKHRQWLATGNNLVAYCEQAEAAAPAFRPRASSARTYEALGDFEGPLLPLPGEASRDEVMAMMTPLVRLPMRHVTWSLDDYAKTHLRESWYYNVLNWGRFEHRYLPILDAFRVGNEAGPGSTWPLPSPDPLAMADAPSCSLDHE
eukprot:CAMPEP_0171105018 /NCGR_PEP_ID=MMETSP0766_2-20121228/61787_1 /TAXON_ID=439317 /ORGANISM="Gambierdiscus australes, Strain CAWD 149" /LENGTH=424 /DNA_ID=CAMNT_0011565759 /DNA_START=51 /DNA_END=1325 /DNA_ORIENTATION=+